MNDLEIEVKFYLPDIPSVRERILELGAECKGRVFETNIRFEDASKSLMRKNSLLRLRKDATAKLTFKSPPIAPDNQFKVRRELEVEVSDFSTMSRILDALGFNEEQVYEKWRETFILGDTHFCIDTMPYGDFLEIEGEKTEIRKLADQLGLKWEKRILTNYLAIFRTVREKLNLSFSDLTFEHFKAVELDLGEFRHLFEMGK
ncbi:MAG: hypothetical protein B6245_24080 [Desulfobacteraceae bacterium 4572_88]|nr:MAG: hypothetical protein B6245_24080 [Desulfobacteraceae bacterium 4572_88]